MTDHHIEEKERRCPRLGGEISFAYCMISGNDSLPCLKILDCWWEAFDVQAYLKEQMTETDYQRLVQATQNPQNKMGSILEIAKLAKRRKTDRK